MAIPITRAFNQDVVTLGVSIDVPEPFKAELSHWRRSSGDPLADLIVPHITLLMPTDVGVADVPAAMDHVARVARSTKPFQIHLAGTETFRPLTPVVFVPVVAGQQECTELQARLRSGILFSHQQFDYHPHVTVAHNLSDDQLDRAEAFRSDYRAQFTASCCGLYQLAASNTWELMQQLPFEG